MFCSFVATFFGGGSTASDARSRSMFAPMQKLPDRDHQFLACEHRQFHPLGTEVPERLSETASAWNGSHVSLQCPNIEHQAIPHWPRYPRVLCRQWIPISLEVHGRHTPFLIQISSGSLTTRDKDVGPQYCCKAVPRSRRTSQCRRSTGAVTVRPEEEQKVAMYNFRYCPAVFIRLAGALASFSGPPWLLLGQSNLGRSPFVLPTTV